LEETPSAPAAPGADLPPEAARKVTALEAQIAANPKAKALYLQLSQLYQEAGRKDLAKAALERLLAVEPGNAYARHRLDQLRRPETAAAAAPAAPRFVPRAAVPPRRPVGRYVAAGLAAVAVLVGTRLYFFPSTRLLVDESHDAHLPRWSPGSDRIAFISNRSGRPEIAVLDVRARQVRPLGPIGYGWSSYAWGPDGRRIAYVASTDEEPEAVHVVDVVSGQSTRVAAGRSPVWSADGASLALVCHGEADAQAATGICVADLTGGTVRQVVPAWAESLASAPVANQIVYEVAPEAPPLDLDQPSPDDGTPPEAPDKALQDMLDSVAGDTSPGTLAEGSRNIAREAEARMFKEKRQGAESYSSFFGGNDIYVLDLVASSPVPIVQGGRAGAPRYTRDGRILFVEGAPGQGTLVFVNPDGSGRRPVFDRAVAVADPGSAALTPDGRRVVYMAPVAVGNEMLAKVMTGESAHDLFVSPVGDPRPRRLENKHSFKQRFSLSPDGRRIVYEVYNPDTKRSSLWLMGL
jgi:dipeptidyl aminopeptidase/acylaminoacyl peptidase